MTTGMIYQPAAQRLSFERGPFRIQRSYPGRGVSDDSGLGPIGAIDHADLLPGLLVPMHEHRDDEIISYLRTGEMVHRDSAGFTKTITPTRLMVMNAGSGFSHEESIPGDTGVTMLQIFVRPRERGLEPGIQFAELSERQSTNAWRKLVGTEKSGAMTTVRSEIGLFDASLEAGSRLEIAAPDGWGWWLYVFSGEVELGDCRCSEGDSAASPDGQTIDIAAESKAELVLFIFDREAQHSNEGSLSGRQSL